MYICLKNKYFLLIYWKEHTCSNAFITQHFSSLTVIINQFLFYFPNIRHSLLWNSQSNPNFSIILHFQNLSFPLFCKSICLLLSSSFVIPLSLSSRSHMVLRLRSSDLKLIPIWFENPLMRWAKKLYNNGCFVYVNVFFNLLETKKLKNARWWRNWSKRFIFVKLTQNIYFLKTKIHT